MTNRWHNMLGSFTDWSKLKEGFEALHKNAEEAGFEVKVEDLACPCCGFRPAVQMKERNAKKIKERSAKKGERS